MKFISTILLLAAMVAQMSSRFVVLLDFELNKDYIAKNLCENRDKPKSCCKGKCYLKKQLAKTDKEENVPSGKTGKNKIEELFCNSFKKVNNRIFYVIQNDNYPASKNEIAVHNYVASVFHPPQV
jgi:hypothetical protein